MARPKATAQLLGISGVMTAGQPPATRCLMERCAILPAALAKHYQRTPVTSTPKLQTGVTLTSCMSMKPRQGHSPQKHMAPLLIGSQHRRNPQLLPHHAPDASRHEMPRQLLQRPYRSLGSQVSTPRASATKPWRLLWDMLMSTGGRTGSTLISSFSVKPTCTITV